MTLTGADLTESRPPSLTPSKASEVGGNGDCFVLDEACTTTSNVDYHTTGATSPMHLHIEYLPVRYGCILSSKCTRLLVSKRDSDHHSVLPAIAFTLDMYRRTGGFFGINEALFSSALAAMVFSLLSCQPLTIVGVTGLIALFNYTIYDIITMYEPTIYPAFTAWVGIWAAIFHWIVAFGNFSDYMAYVTDFSSETFGMYVGIIYCSRYSPISICDCDANYLSSQRRGRTRLPLRANHHSWRLPLHRHCNTLLRLRLRPREARKQHAMEAMGTRYPCRLRLRLSNLVLGRILLDPWPPQGH